MRLLFLDRDQEGDGSRLDLLAAVSWGAGTSIDVAALDTGPATGAPSLNGMGRMEQETAVVLAGGRAQDEGYDAVVVDGPWDPGVEVLRSMSRIPVVGTGGAAIAMAALLGRPLAIAVDSEESRLAVERAISLRGTHEAVRSVDVVPDPGDESRGLSTWASGAIARGARALVIGSPSREHLASLLGARHEVPVLAPAVVGLKMAELLVDLGLVHSSFAYLAPATDPWPMLRSRIGLPEPGIARLPTSGEPARSYRLKVVVPISGMTSDDLALRAQALAPGILHEGTRVAYHGLSDSSNSADCQADSFVLDVFCAEEAARADAQGYDAVLVDSTTDSGISAVRPHLDALALGPGEACWTLASILGSHLTILSMESKWRHFFLKNLRSAGMLDHLTSIEDIGAAPDPVRLFEGKEDVMNARLVEAAWRGIEKGADVVIIGSTTMHQSFATLEQALPVPVLSPGRVGVRMAELLLDLSLRHPRPDEPGATSPERMFVVATRTDANVVEI